MTDWNGSGYCENSSIDEKFLSPKIYYLVYSQHPGLHKSRYFEDYWNFGMLVQWNRIFHWNKTWCIWISTKPSCGAFWPDIGQKRLFKFPPFSQGMGLNLFHSSHSIYHSLFSHPQPPTHQPTVKHTTKKQTQHMPKFLSITMK